MRKILVILLLTISCCIKAQNSQFTNPPVHYPTPASVWQFTKFGDIPVSEYRGLANINIPLHDISLDGVNIPLQLDYYSGGLRVSEEASLVGLGWSFNLPSIIQNVKDANDYLTTTIHQKIPPYQGNPAIPSDEIYSFINGNWSTNISQYIGISPIQNIPYFVNVLNQAILVDHSGYYNSNNKYTQMIMNSTVDSEPDLFTLNLNGVEIKFMREQSARDNYIPSFELLPLKIINGRTEYKVSLITESNTQYPQMAISGIQVIDPSGNVYFFKQIDASNYNGLLRECIFKLTKIVTNKNKEVNFTYSSLNRVIGFDKFSCTYIRRTSETSHTMTGSGTDINGAYSSWGGGYFGNGISGTNEIIFHKIINSQKDIQDMSFLQTISTPTEIVSFSYSDRVDYLNMKKLDQIEVKSTVTNQLTKKYNLNYDYFTSQIDVNTSNPDNSDFSFIDSIDENTVPELPQSGSAPNTTINQIRTSRLKLVSVQQYGHNPYIFEYNSTPLPAKNSFSVDYWGFYNGHNNLNLYPDLTDLGYPNYTENIANDFNSNLFYSKACVLEKIVYPTMGYTTFEYGLHQFDNLIFNFGSNTPIINTGGGLRIESIKNFNHNNQQTSSKSYQYFDGKSLTKKVICKASVDHYASCNFKIFSTPTITCTLNNYVNQTNNCEGNFIGYGRVTILDNGTTQNGKIEKEFVNIPLNSINPYGSFFPSAETYYNSNSLKNGIPLKEKIYDSNTNVKLVKEFSYENVYLNNLDYAMAKQSNGVRIYSPGNGAGTPECELIIVSPKTLCTFYPIKHNYTRLISEKTTEYFPSGAISKRSAYTYDLKNNLINQQVTLLPNTVISSESKSMTYGQNPLHLSKNIVSLPSQEITIQNGQTINSKEYIYEESAGITRVKQINSLPEGNPDESLKSKMFIDLYDELQNINQYHFENGINTCIVWGYNKTLPIAKIENISYDQIQSYVNAVQQASNTNNEADLLNALQTFRNSITSQYPFAMITTYTHIPLIGTSTITDPKGDKISYIYDLYGRLKSVKDKDGNILTENEYHYKSQN